MRAVRAAFNAGSRRAVRRFNAPATRSLYTDFVQPSSRPWTPPLTKICATIGPTSEQFEDLQPLVTNGLRIMRLNFSHATYEEAELRMTNLKKCKGRHVTTLGKDKNVRAVLLDTQGPEIRSGKLLGDDTGKKSIQFVAGEKVVLSNNPALKEASTNTDLYVTYADIAQTIQNQVESAGHASVLLDDGAVCLSVESVDLAAGTVTCLIENTGDLRSRAGVNLPNASIKLPPMSEKDKQDIRYGLANDVDFVAASFVRDAAGVNEIRSFMRGVMTDELNQPADAVLPLIISKIENAEALRNFDDILLASDGIMVARGDLGVEIPIQEVVNSQKEMVTACNAAGKPVIVATQMLESMAKNPRPTRAEVADVTNAVYDGADCVMLSGETAKGKYCTETVQTMNEIIHSAENFVRRNNVAAQAADKTAGCQYEAVAVAACGAAEKAGAKAIVVLTKTGATARLVAKQRPNIPILAFCPEEKVGRQLIINRGCHPILGGSLAELPLSERPGAAVKSAKAMGFLNKGDTFVLVQRETDEEMGTFTSMRIAETK